jgi:hypothetical protein
MDAKPTLEYCAAAGGYAFQMVDGPDYVRATMRGHMTVEDAHHTEALCQEMRQRLGRRYPLQLDLGELEGVAPGARPIIFANTATDAAFTRLAAVGASYELGMLFGLYGRVSKIPLKYFPQREEADAWLKEPA